MDQNLRPNRLQKPSHRPRYNSSEVQTTFRAKLEHLTVTPQCNECARRDRRCGRRYVQVEKLRNWLKQKCPEQTNTTWADLCLEAAKKGHHAGSLSLSDINAPDRECLLVYSILCDIASPSLIQEFQRLGFTDTKLPISLLDLENELKQSAIHDWARVAKEFDDRQWAFCPIKFDLSCSFACKKRAILPICRRGILSNKGGTALLWQIAVQEEFVGRELRKITTKAKFHDNEFGVCYQFALKTFRAGHADFFEQERDAFWALREHEGMIRFLGDFSHPSDPGCQPEQENGLGGNGESGSTVHVENMPGTASTSEQQVSRMTTNILLEWGESDLEVFFAEHQPPVLGSDVRIFWKELFGVAEALQRVHNFQKRNGQEFDGWHADIKPDNILRVQSRFKLSDPGFAKFEPKKPNNTTRISGGTSTYGAPEWERSRGCREPVPQSIDIWSLGCVFSIAATWVALGYKGILLYEKLRENEIRATLNSKQVQDHLSQNERQERPEADYFHNGSDVLGIIRGWHDVLRKYIGQMDSVTGRILDLVTNEMLQGEPSQRISATSLCTKLTSILDSCPANPDFVDLPKLQRALDEVQAENQRLHAQHVPEPSSNKESPIQGRAARDAQKSYNVHRARMKSEYFRGPAIGSYLWPSTSFDKSKASASSDHSSANSDTNWGNMMQVHHYSTHQPRPFTKNGSTGHSKRPVIAPLKRASTVNPRKPQNVFQARHELEELDAEKRRTISGRVKDMVSTDRKKNSFLAEFFENRDLIFVADNAGSMAEQWPEATNLLDVLVRTAKNLDENGMDLYFTHTTGKPNAALNQDRDGKLRRAPTLPKVNGKNDVSKFRAAMKIPDSRPVPGAKTDMSLVLGFLLDKYIMHLKDVGINKAKDQTIIVLTDGNWEIDTVSKVIKDFVDHWKGLARERMESRSMGIQFVQFGNVPDATMRLDYLDNGLSFEGVPDIVDTESSLGDVYKMLIGSFIEEYDRRRSLPTTSPPAPTFMSSEPEISSRPPHQKETNNVHQNMTDT